MNQPALSAFIWSVADLLRGDYKQSEYGKVILPFTVLRRLDCVLEATKPAVLAELAKRQKLGVNPEPFLLRATGDLKFFNTSPLDMKKLVGDADHIKENLYAYIQAFSADVRDIFECFDFYVQIERLAKAGLLYQVTQRFAAGGPAPQGGGQHPDGRRLRGADPQVRRDQQRNRRRALHAARGDPPDGGPAVHRRQRRAQPARRGAHPVRPHRRHRRHAVGGGRVPGAS